jgi:hypothetical protein
VASGVSIPIRFPEGVSIRDRSIDLRPLGYSAAAIEAFQEDWSPRMGHGSYVIVVNRQVNKSPDNFARTDATLVIPAQRALNALRLADRGDIAMGPMWYARSERFIHLLRASARSGSQIPVGPGEEEFQLTTQTIRRARLLQPMLKQLDEHGYHGLPAPPVNLDLALRSFLATYDRFPSRPDSQLLDVITAAEAVLSTSSTEITFRLAFRIAGLLGWTPQTRAHVFESMKLFYDTRSRIVHGQPLRPKHADMLAQVEEARDYVRRLLCAFVPIAARSAPTYDKKFFDTGLDIVLQDERARRRLIRELKIPR